MSPDAIEACARRVEELEAECVRWKAAYIALAGSRMRLVETALKKDRLPVNVRARVRNRIKDTLRKGW